MTDTIYIANRKYFFYAKFKTWKEAYNLARYYKRKVKTRYFILARDAGYMFPRKMYYLYFNKLVRMI